MRRWIALAVTLMIAALLSAMPSAADRELPGAAETFAEIPDEKFMFVVSEWWANARSAETGTETERVMRLPVLMESAQLCMDEIRTRYRDGRLDASVLERLLEEVRYQADSVWTDALETLDRLLSDGMIDMDTYITGTKTAMKLGMDTAEKYISEIEQSYMDGIMDGLEYADEAQDVLDSLMESFRDSFGICGELMEGNLVTTDQLLSMIQDIASGGFWTLDRTDGILTKLFVEGDIDDDAYYDAMTDVIRSRTEWLEALTGLLSGLLDQDMLDEAQDKGASEFLLAETTVLIGEYDSYLDGMYRIGRIDGISYKLMKSWMEEFGKEIDLLIGEISGNQPAA